MPGRNQEASRNKSASQREWIMGTMKKGMGTVEGGTVVAASAGDQGVGRDLQVGEEPGR